LDSQDAVDGSEPRTWACAHDSLQRVGICVVAREWTAKTWMAVANYVVQFGKGCPALRRVVLYVRDVQVAAQNPEFRALREIVGELILRSVHVWSESDLSMLLVNLILTLHSVRIRCCGKEPWWWRQEVIKKPIAQGVRARRLIGTVAALQLRPC